MLCAVGNVVCHRIGRVIIAEKAFSHLRFDHETDYIMVGDIYGREFDTGCRGKEAFDEAITSIS